MNMHIKAPSMRKKQAEFKTDKTFQKKTKKMCIKPFCIHIIH